MLFFVFRIFFAMEKTSVVFATLIVNSLLLSSLHAAQDKCKDPELRSPIHRLSSYLLCEYKRFDRPPSYDNITRIYQGIIPRHANFDEYTGKFEFMAQAIMRWRDTRLIWKNAAFDNITKLSMVDWKIWTPDIFSLNHGGDDTVHHNKYTMRCTIQQYHENVVCMPISSYVTICRTDFTMWPYDRHNCTFLLGSWSYSIDELLLLDEWSSPVFMDFLKTSGEWKIALSRASHVNVTSHYRGNSTISLLALDFILDRADNHLSATNVASCAIMTIMTLSTLWLQPQSIERLGVASLNPIIHLLCIQNIHEVIPHNGSTTPLMIRFYINSFVLATLALLMTFVMRKIRALKNSPPSWISSSVTLILRSKLAEFLSITILDPEATTIINNDEDVTDNVFDSTIWDRLTLIIGWISFITFFLIYVIMYAVLVPNSSMEPPKSVAHEYGFF